MKKNLQNKWDIIHLQAEEQVSTFLLVRTTRKSSLNHILTLLSHFGQNLNCSLKCKFTETLLSGVPNVKMSAAKP